MRTDKYTHLLFQTKYFSIEFVLSGQFYIRKSTFLTNGLWRKLFSIAICTEWFEWHLKTTDCIGFKRKYNYQICLTTVYYILTLNFLGDFDSFYRVLFLQRNCSQYRHCNTISYICHYLFYCIFMLVISK